MYPKVTKKKSEILQKLDEFSKQIIVEASAVTTTTASNTTQPVVGNGNLFGSNRGSTVTTNFIPTAAIGGAGLFHVPVSVTNPISPTVGNSVLFNTPVSTTGSNNGLFSRPVGNTGSSTGVGFFGRGTTGGNSGSTSIFNNSGPVNLRGGCLGNSAPPVGGRGCGMGLLPTNNSVSCTFGGLPANNSSTSGFPNPFGGSRGASGSFGGTVCHNCQGSGHTNRDCPNPSFF